MQATVLLASYDGMTAESGNNEALLKDTTEKKDQGTKLYAKRWFMLIQFIFLSASNGAQWIEYSIIATIIMDYYNVPFLLVDWTSMIYMATYIVFFIPASWILDKYGLRVSLILGAAGNCIGAWIKIFSTEPDRFWITFAGQTIAGASQMFTLGIPPRLAAVWFGENEVSTACAAGVFGNQLGIALGFVLPPLIVKAGTKEEIGWDLNTLFLGSAVLNSLILVSILCFFSARPELPPSSAQQSQLQDEAPTSHAGTIKQLMCSRDFLLLFITYGMNTGVFYAVSTLLAQMVLEIYPKETETVGQIGLCIVVAGMLGSVAGGYALDKFHKYKLTTLLVYFFSFVGMATFTVTLELGIWIVFINAFCLGFFMTGYLPIGFEFAAEITFPAAEGTMSGLLNASAQIFGMILIPIAGHIMHTQSTTICNAFMVGTLLIGLVLTAVIREDLKRRNAQKRRDEDNETVAAVSL